MTKRFKIKKRNKKIISMVLAVLAVAFIVFAISVVDDVFTGSLDQPSIQVTIKEDDNSHSVAQILKENRVIKHKFIFELVSNMKGANDRYYAGEFEIKKGSGYSKIINGLVYRSTYKTTNITIPEGSKLKEIGKIVANTGYITEDEFNRATTLDYDYDFLNEIKRKDNKLEGYLFPDTYNISNSMSAQDVIELMLERFDEIFTDEYESRAKKLGYSVDEIVTLASIVEGEAGADNDRALVASVFHNRLKSKSYPYLESCATVQYILGERKAILSAKDTKIKSPYNTYINKGLPIGPICSPGRASIEAALYPSDTEYQFFQSDEKGKIYYAKTLDEHEHIRQKIQK